MSSLTLPTYPQSPPPIGKRASTLAWSDRQFNRGELCLRCLIEARLSTFGVVPQYLGIDLRLTTATILARFDTKVSPIPSSNCIVCAALVLSPRRIRSNRAFSRS